MKKYIVPVDFSEHSDYANIIGAATESVIRVLADFHRAGLISMQGKNIKIKNVAGLKAKASSVTQ